MEQIRAAIALFGSVGLIGYFAYQSFSSNEADPAGIQSSYSHQEGENSGLRKFGRMADDYISNLSERVRGAKDRYWRTTRDERQVIQPQNIPTEEIARYHMPEQTEIEGVREAKKKAKPRKKERIKKRSIIHMKREKRMMVKKQPKAKKVAKKRLRTKQVRKGDALSTNVMSRLTNVGKVLNEPKLKYLRKNRDRRESEFYTSDNLISSKEFSDLSGQGEYEVSEGFFEVDQQD